MSLEFLQEELKKAEATLAGAYKQQRNVLNSPGTGTPAQRAGALAGIQGAQTLINSLKLEIAKEKGREQELTNQELLAEQQTQQKQSNGINPLILLGGIGLLLL